LFDEKKLEIILNFGVVEVTCQVCLADICVALSFFFDVMWWLMFVCGFACFFILVIHFLFLFSYWSTSSSIHLILISSLTISYTKIAISYVCSKRFHARTLITTSVIWRVCVVEWVDVEIAVFFLLLVYELNKIVRSFF
jgi:hypothetical protein